MRQAAEISPGDKTMAVWANYKPTNVEKRAIKDGFALIYRRCDAKGYTDAAMLREARWSETHGSQRINGTAAEALLIGWYLRGYEKPETPLHHLFGLREASIKMHILGASHSTFTNMALSAPLKATLQAACDAHQATFDRMIESDRIAALAA
jgi:hypothetical protein